VALGDFNGDGTDIAVADREPQRAVLLGNGGGTFQAGRSLPLAKGAAIAVGDTIAMGNQT
jgi:hypothetical protein